MDSNSIVKGALRIVRNRMKEMGLSAKGSVFYTTKCDNTILLSIQKSVESSATESKLAVNYGVYSLRIGNRCGDPPSAARDLWKAHWRKRYSEEGMEKWFSVKPTDSADEIARMLICSLETVLVEAFAHSTDEALRDEWLSCSSPGIGQLQRLLYLALLVNDIGPSDRLASVVRELRSLVSGGVHEKLMERELARAGIRIDL